MTLTYRLSLPGRGDTELRGLPCHPATLPAPHRDPVSVQGAPTSTWQTKQHPGEEGRRGGGSSQPWHFTARVVLPPATSWGEHIQETTADVWSKFNLLASASSDTADIAGREEGRRLWPSSWGQPQETPPPLPLGEEGGMVFMCALSAVPVFRGGGLGGSACRTQCPRWSPQPRARRPEGAAGLWIC